MPRRERKPIPEEILRDIWTHLQEDHMGFANRGTRVEILSALFRRYRLDFSERQFRMALDQLNRTQRIVCSTPDGTYIPTTQEEFDRGFRFRHGMAVKLLDLCGEMKAAWEAWQLTKDSKRGAALPTADVEARAS